MDMHYLKVPLQLRVASYVQLKPQGNLLEGSRRISTVTGETSFSTQPSSPDLNVIPRVCDLQSYGSRFVFVRQAR